MTYTPIFTLLFALAASLCMLHAAIVNGTCGDNLTWTLNTKDSTLTIEGTGNMNDWNAYSHSQPWYQYFSYIKYINLPEGLTNIGSHAFYTCSNLISIDLPNSVTHLEWNAFSYCTGLKRVKIGTGLVSLGDAFEECKNLEAVYISDLSAWSKISVFYGDNPLYHAKHLYLNGTEVTNLVIPDDVTAIGNGIFCFCLGLTNVTIPDHVTSIGERAFIGCRNLSTLYISSNVSAIGESTFEDCNGLTELSIPNSVQNIYSKAFQNCSNLTNVTIGSGITNIGWAAFESCPITRLTVYASTPPAGGTNCGINNTACTLYVPAECVDTYANAAWWEDFASIRAIGSNMIVKFVDWDGTILSTQNIDEGESAIAPSNPTREGYTFIGWDKDFSNVTEDMVVTALYKINRYEVNFVDWDNIVLKSDSVDWNTAAIAPTNPYRKGYTFIGWNKNFEHITSDETIMAQYEMGEEKDVTILYTNGNDGGTILSHSVVLKMPEAPEIEGFTFLGWQPKAEFIDEIIEIQAIYKSDSEAAPQVVANPSNPSQKLIRNGNVYILTDNKTYTIQGQEVK